MASSMPHGFRGRGRGNFGQRGRGGRGGRDGRGGGPGRYGVPEVDDGRLLEGLNGVPLKVWTVKSIADDILENGHGVDSTVNCMGVVASYNYNDTAKPTVLVPGAPKQFNQWGPGDLSELYEKCRAVRDETNLDGVFVAVRIMQPQFKLTHYDIVCSVEALTYFYRFFMETVNTIRAKSNQSIMPGFKRGRKEGKVRIDAELIGSTVFLHKHAVVEEGPPAGYGIAFREVCGKMPSASMVTSGRAVEGAYKMVKETNLGDLRLLLVDDVEAAQYPTQIDSGGTYNKTEMKTDLEVEIEGYKGDPNLLDPVSLASRKGNEASVPLHHSKYFNQILFGVSYRYVGRHDKGHFRDRPTLKNLDEIRAMCDLDESYVKIWLKVMNSILTNIVSFCRSNGTEMVDDRMVARFGIVSDPQGEGNLAIYEDIPSLDGQKNKVVSDDILEYLMSTV